MQQWKVNLYCCLMCSDVMRSCSDVSAKHSIIIYIFTSYTTLIKLAVLSATT